MRRKPGGDSFFDQLKDKAILDLVKKNFDYEDVEMFIDERGIPEHNEALMFAALSE